ncbi:AraC family transcriptional regulator [Fundicoccus culcitae]|uniref:AraC family transcriptional regulator n=1 Tax=Fundicoccus culcitae TaxID=2969821 RepID=A0ABY5P5S5_9LACT|nr:AraC family transcriptional regulator [Fundicoccus culcitae]UUX33899.1 AraC family transcriptional regulator [Fundicoccus culcitae]
MSVYLEIPEFDSNFQIRSFTNDGMTIVYPHWHKEIEIIHADKGHINIGVNNQVITVQEGETIFFASGEPHYFLASPNSERIVLQFDLSLLRENSLAQKDDRSLVEVFSQGERHSANWQAETARKVEQLVRQLHQTVNSSLEGKKYLVMADLYQLVSLYFHEIPKQSSTAVRTKSTNQSKDVLDQVNDAVEYIEAHYFEQITLGDVAEAVGFSPYYFTRFFKKNMGMTFVEFLREYRLNQAMFILANEDVPMTEVAEKSGFGSVKTFHHVFKEQMGISPLQYQKSLQRKMKSKIS